MELTVESRAQSRADEEPRAVHLDGVRWRVDAILDRWHDAGLTRDRAVRDIFKVRLDSGRILFLERDRGTGAWALRPESFPLGKLLDG